MKKSQRKYISTEKTNKYADLVDDTTNLLEAIDLVENTYISKKNSYTYRDQRGITWKKEPATVNQLKYIPERYGIKTKWDAHRFFTYKSVLSLIKKYRKSSK